MVSSLDVSIVLTEKGASTAVALAESGFSGAHATPSLPAEPEEDGDTTSRG
jgi:hypothetical protein